MATQRRMTMYPCVASPAEQKGSALFSTLAPISAGCVVSAFFMYPFDVVRALKMASASDAAAASQSTVQLIRNFVSAHGVKGLVSQGVMPEMARATVMRVVQFFSYPLCHEALTGKKPSEGTPMTKLVSGMAASLPSALAITPLENAKIALQLDKENRFGNNMGNAARHLWRRGVLAPYVGLQAIFTRSAVSFGPYIATLPYAQSFTKPMVHNAMGDGPLATVLGNLTGGFLAGSLGAAINCPFDLVRTNLQKQAIALANEPMSTGTILRLTFSYGQYFEVAKQIVRANGIGALYMGLTFKVMHIGGTGAMNAAFIPFFKKLMGVDREIM